MGNPVTVDSDDLQSLLFATGTIKQIEAAIQQHKQDPQVRIVQDNLTQAHDNLAKAWRSSVRVIEDPLYNIPVTKSEMTFLKRIGLSVKTIESEDLVDDLVKTLRRKHMLEVGVRSTQTAWGDTGLSKPECLENVIRLTPRAISVVYPENEVISNNHDVVSS